jgi:hypothetical protein
VNSVSHTETSEEIRVVVVWRTRGVCVYDHSELWRTRRCVPERGFLTTIQNMMDVAKLSAYLYTLAKPLWHTTMREGWDIPCEDILRMVIPQIDRRRPPNRHALRFALIIREQIRCCKTLALITPNQLHDSLIVSSTHTL